MKHSTSRVRFITHLAGSAAVFVAMVTVGTTILSAWWVLLPHVAGR